MSEVRQADAVFKFRIKEKNALFSGKKILKIELFRAEQWHRNWRPYKRNMHPRPPIRDNQKYFNERYRLRINGRWYKTDGYKFTFLNFSELRQLIKKMTKNQFI